MESTAKPDTRVLDALRRIGPLPVLGGTVARVRALADDPVATTGDLVAVVEADEAFAANLLRYANSAANARPIRARTIRQAITLVGRRQLARIAVEAATYRFLSRFPGGGELSRGQLHVHAVAVAAYAAAAAELRGAHVDSAHLAGLLHDVGKLLMPEAFGVAAVDAIAAEAPYGRARATLERRRFGLDHAGAGALLAGLSDPSDEVVRAIACHHGGPSGVACPSAEAACVQIGDAIAHVLVGGDVDPELLEVALARLDAGPELLDEVAERARVVPSGEGGQLSEAVGRLEAVAHLDDLTGLANRRHWIDRVRRELAGGAEGAVLICDVDDFKAVNDGHGHRAGDLVLTEVARVLARHGFAGRLGGDEFAVWAPGADGHATARAIIDEVALSMPDPITHRCAPLSVSVGVAGAPAEGDDVIELLERADRALYAGRPGGRGR
ncbi:MAG TPA: HDOD domain-containing protein [Solirubrobacteraceae bacterium]|jgi:diguanylate cyclase (GGDEF)-like protein/putative nucleotidyltransferase with HDIG domain